MLQSKQDNYYLAMRCQVYLCSNTQEIKSSNHSLNNTPKHLPKYRENIIPTHHLFNKKLLTYHSSHIQAIATIIRFRIEEVVEFIKVTPRLSGNIKWQRIFNGDRNFQSEWSKYLIKIKSSINNSNSKNNSIALEIIVRGVKITFQQRDRNSLDQITQQRKSNLWNSQIVWAI